MIFIWSDCLQTWALCRRGRMPYVNSLVEAEVLEPGPTTDSLGSKSDQVEIVGTSSSSFTDRLGRRAMVPGC